MPISTTLAITLQNPAPNLDAFPPNDNFTGVRLNGEKWETQSSGGGTVRQDERLILTTSAAEAFSDNNVRSRWRFSGDFDVEVAFEIGEGWGLPSVEHLDGANLGVTIGSQSYWITRLRSTGEDKVFSMNSADSVSGEMVTSAVSGKYRILRKGTTLLILFDVGEGWQKIAEKTVGLDEAQLFLSNGSIFASQAFTTYFDDVKLNSGLTTYRLKVYLPALVK